MSETLKIKPITASYYRELPEGPPYYQLIDGNLEMTPAPNSYHQIVARNLNRALDRYIADRDLGDLFFAPIDLYLADINVFQPDFIFMAIDSQAHIKKDGIHGGPELVIEILSPSTAKFDLGHKKSVYARCGVLEYWIVDPETRSVTVFDFEKSAEEPSAKLEETSALTSSLFPGLEISLADIFAGPELED